MDAQAFVPKVQINVQIAVQNVLNVALDVVHAQEIVVLVVLMAVLIVKLVAHRDILNIRTNKKEINQLNNNRKKNKEIMKQNKEGLRMNKEDQSKMSRKEKLKNNREQNMNRKKD
ncbi:MAG: hypothetical protein EZS28_012957 [Streblomastix strix]|uniref:Uncharacterized protein n=1 Tax=Streblomastix strix TaxID=222440 RepID=A0A5J4WA38_9EUKA|nr:MAG: hypothetical protein EZS28_012957 [Streblomastix strix]